MYFQNFIQFDYITNPKITNPTCPIFKMIYYLKSQINPKNSKTNPKFQMNTKLPKTPQKFPNLKIPNESKNPKKSLDSGLLLAQQICVQYLNHYQYITWVGKPRLQRRWKTWTIQKETWKPLNDSTWNGNIKKHLCLAQIEKFSSLSVSY